MELYGGLGSTNAFGFHQTAHYLAPAVSWQISDNASLRFSLGRATTAEQIDKAAADVVQQVQFLREMSPLWVNPRPSDMP